MHAEPGILPSLTSFLIGTCVTPGSEQCPSPSSLRQQEAVSCSLLCNCTRSRLCMNNLLLPILPAITRMPLLVLHAYRVAPPCISFSSGILPCSVHFPTKYYTPPYTYAPIVCTPPPLPPLLLCQDLVVPIEVDVVLVGFSGDGGYGYTMDSSKLLSMLSSHLQVC